MNDPELPAADNQGARLTDGFQALREKPLPGASSLYRADFLASGSDAPSPPPPTAPPAEADEAEEIARYAALLGNEPSTAAESHPRTEKVLSEAIRQALEDIDSEPNDQPVVLDEDTRRQEIEELQAEVEEDRRIGDTSEDALDAKKRYYDLVAVDMHPEAGSAFEFLQTLQAEYRRLEGEEYHGAYKDIDWLLGVDPQLVRKLPREVRKALKAFGHEQNSRTRDELEYQIAMAALITNRQLQDFATSDTAYSAAESKYEKLLHEDNPPANPGFRDAFVNRNAAAIEFYARANVLRVMRVDSLKKWGLIPTSPAAATLTPPPTAPDPDTPSARPSERTYTAEQQTRFAEREKIAAEAIHLAEEQGTNTAAARAVLALANDSALSAEERDNAWRDFRPILDRLRRGPPPDIPDANRVPEDIRAGLLMNFVNEMLRACPEDATAIEVSPAILAGYLKEAVKIPVKIGIFTKHASFKSAPILTVRGEGLTASGSIEIVMAGGVNFSVAMHNSRTGGGVQMEGNNSHIEYHGLAGNYKDKIEARIANLNQELLNAVNARINPDWETTNFRIANGGLEFNFERKGTEEVQDYDPDGEE